jgi:hypothetical protein|nr:MAG TPA: Protein of unknown function (DUF1642) [Caudoviricetes sp.]
MVQKDITLKQVLNKIKDMDEKHKVEWVYSLLKEFGSEVTSKLYHEGYEQGKFEEAIKFSTPHVEIPTNISEWIVYCKENNFNLLGALSPVGDFGEPLANSFKGDAIKCAKWAMANSNIFADAWVNGYKVKKEKYYYVAIPVGEGVYNRLCVTCSGEIFLDTHNYHSMDKLIKHTKQSILQLTEGMIKESPLSWAWQFAKELED